MLKPKRNDNPNENLKLYNSEKKNQVPNPLTKTSANQSSDIYKWPSLLFLFEKANLATIKTSLL